MVEITATAIVTSGVNHSDRIWPVHAPIKAPLIVMISFPVKYAVKNL